MGPGKHAFRCAEPGLHDGHHRAGDLVDEGIHLLLALAGDRRLIRQHHLRDRQLVVLGVLPQFLHRPERVLRRVLLGRRVALPLDEAAAHRVVLLLEEHGVAGHQLGGHGVRVVKVPFGRVVDDVFERQIERLAAELQREGLIGFVAHLVEKQGIDGGRLLAEQPRERGALRAVPLSGRAEAAEQVHLESRRLRECVRRELRAPLVEVVGNAHRPDRVRARGAWSHLVELVQHRHHRPLALSSPRSGWGPAGARRGLAEWRLPRESARVPCFRSPLVRSRSAPRPRRSPALRMMNRRRSKPAGISEGTCAVGSKRILAVIVPQ